ncbi:MAG: HEAT repeat domain-containing protein [Tepidiformaceae bacterium]
MTPYFDLVEGLGDPDPSKRALALKAMHAAGDAAIAAAILGLSHPDWRVRRGCAMYADHHPDPELLQRLRLTLHDPKAKVRKWAVHALACDPCKPGGNPVDPIPPAVSALKDHSVRVRRAAAWALAAQPPQKRSVRALRRTLASETDVKVLQAIGWGLSRAV